MEKKLKIVIADDNSGWCELLKNYLEKFEEFEIVGITSDSMEELEMIKNLEIDILITDLRRKNGISGFEILKKCYEENLLKNTKILVETGGYYREEMILLHNIGIKHIIFKPFPIQQIREELIKIQNEEEKDLIIINKEISKKKRTLLDIIKSKLMNLN